MDKERVAYLNGIVDQLVHLGIAERTIALTHLYNLRTAAVEDLNDLSDSRQNWDIALGSPDQPDVIRALIHDLTQLANDELIIVGMQVSEKTIAAQEQLLQTVDDGERAKLQAQLAANAEQARQSYAAAREDLDMKHKMRLAQTMKEVRDSIEQGIKNGQDITTLEEIFDRIEQEFWDQHPRSSEYPGIKTEEQ